MIAGLLAVPGLAELVGAWRQAKAEVVKARDARDEARDAERETTMNVRVLDALWDRSMSELSGLTFLLSGRDAKSEPYAQLFGTVKANELQRLGPAKATPRVEPGGRVAGRGGRQAEVLEDLPRRRSRRSEAKNLRST